MRSELGIAVHGPDRFMEAATALFRAPLWDVAGAHRYGIYDIGHHEAAGTLLPAGRGDRWLYGVRWEPGRRELAEFTEERFTRLIRLATGVADLQPQIERIGGFSFAAQLAERFRCGNAFLIGDAAHRVSPRGGTGMNTAIHDGFDLGWKLAWVLRGWAGADLLDTYELERRPVVEHNLARTVDPTGSVRDVGRELRADLGDRIAHVWVPTPSGHVSTLDLLGTRAHALHRPGAQALGGCGRLCPGPSAARRPATRLHHRTGTRHPHRRRAAGAPRRRPGRLVVERRRCRSGAAGRSQVAHGRSRPLSAGPARRRLTARGACRSHAIRAILAGLHPYGLLERRNDVLRSTQQLCRVPHLPK